MNSALNLTLLDDERTLLYLFIGFRLIMALVYQPYRVDGAARGLTTFGDYPYFYDLAKLSDSGKLPYRDYWYEYPPVLALLPLSVYAAASLRGTPDFTAYATLLGLVVTAFDVGNLLLIRRIGMRVHGNATGIALGWIYALLAAPLILTWWTFEAVTVFSILLTLYFLLARRTSLSAAAAAFGALAKLFPLALIGVVVRFYPPRTAIRYVAIVLILVGLGLGAVIAFGGSLGVASLLSQFNKASYQSIWALIDHNYRTGSFGAISDHFDVTRAYALQGNPAVFPAWLRLIVFGAIGGVVFARTRRFDAQGVIAFAAITITLFFLWAQGWSPQWQATLIVLILLNFPTRDGVLACLALGLDSFFEYPVLFEQTGAAGGVISAQQLPLYTLLILTRTGLLIGFAFALYRRLRVPAAPEPFDESGESASSPHPKSLSPSQTSPKQGEGASRGGRASQDARVTPLSLGRGAGGECWVSSC